MDDLISRQAAKENQMVFEEYSLTLRHIMNCDGERVNIDQPIVCKVVLDRTAAKNPTYVLNELISRMEKFVYDKAVEENCPNCGAKMEA